MSNHPDVLSTTAAGMQLRADHLLGRVLLLQNLKRSIDTSDSEQRMLAAFKTQKTMEKSMEKLQESVIEQRNAIQQMVQDKEATQESVIEQRNAIQQMVQDKEATDKFLQDHIGRAELNAANVNSRFITMEGRNKKVGEGAQKVVDKCEVKMKNGFDNMVQEIKKCMDTFGIDQEAKNMDNIKNSELGMAARLSAVETKLRGELIPSSAPNNNRPMAMLELGNPFDTSATRSQPASSPDTSLLPDISLLDTGFAQS